MSDKKEKPQNVWNKKNGWISKSYHLKEDVVLEFSEACELTGVSQAGQLSYMMMLYAQKVKKSKDIKE